MESVDERVENLVRQLQHLVDQKDLTSAHRTGNLVVDGLFDGDVKAWRRKDKGPLYAQLAAHSELPISSGDLRRSLRIYELCHRIPTVLIGRRITLSHVTAILRLDDEDQARFLLMAQQRSLTVRQLRCAILESAPPARTGRPGTPPVYKTLLALSSEHAFDGSEALAAVDAQTAGKRLLVVRHSMMRLKTIEVYLQQAAAAAMPLMRVLVAAPTPIFTGRARRQLRDAGCIVQTAGSFAEALARMDVRTSCVVISLALPDGSALDLSRQLMATRPSLRCLFVADGPRALPPEVSSDFAPIFYKSSGQAMLRTALMMAMRPPPTPIEPAG